MDGGVDEGKNILANVPLIWNGQGAELFVISDEMKRRNQRLWDDLLADMADPDDYFKGVRRSAETAPDNMIAFVRHAAVDLHPGHGMASFHQRWVLLVVLKGRGWATVDREDVPLHPGDVLLVPPLHLHGYRDVDAAITWLFLTFEWPQHTAASLDACRPRRLDAGGKNLLEAVLRQWRGPSRDGDILAVHLLRLIRHIFPPQDSFLKSAPALATSGMIAAVHKTALEQPGIQIAALARRIGISESHLRARFRSEVGISLGRYLREHRLRQAMLWLKEENLTVKAAAERAGYPDIHTFSRAFHRLLGVPPSTLRPTKLP